MKNNKPTEPSRYRGKSIQGGAPSSAKMLRRTRKVGYAPLREVDSPDQGNRLIRRLDSIDWRYKVQITVGLGLAIILATYIFRDAISALDEWGYLGAFLINGISSATIIFPAPGGIVIAIMAQDFNPLFIGMAAGVGGTLGGSTAYFAGLANSGSLRQNRWLKWFETILMKSGSQVIFIFALVPILPGDFASIMAGGIRFPFHKYLFLNALGSMIKMTVVAYIGAEYLHRLEEMFLEWWRGLY